MGKYIDYCECPVDSFTSENPVSWYILKPTTEWSLQGRFVCGKVDKTCLQCLLISILRTESNVPVSMHTKLVSLLQILIL